MNMITNFSYTFLLANPESHQGDMGVPKGPAIKSFMGLVVIIEAHEVPRFFWILSSFSEILISCTRSHNKLMFLLPKFSDVWG